MSEQLEKLQDLAERAEVLRDQSVERLTRSPMPVIYIISGFLCGLGLGYILGQRSRKMPIPPPADELQKITDEIEAIRARREAKEPQKLVVFDQDRLDEGKSFAQVLLEDPDIRTEGPDVIITRLVDEDWNYTEETKTRESLSPYVIHKDEFWSNEMEFAQHTWTYYAGDDVMIDEEDVVIYNHDQKIGELKFGHGSGDPNTVYIRNEKMKTEMEVLREEGLYSIEVMGMEMERGEDKEVEHSMVHKSKRGKKDERLT